MTCSHSEMLHTLIEIHQSLSLRKTLRAALRACEKLFVADTCRIFLHLPNETLHRCFFLSATLPRRLRSLPYPKSHDLSTELSNAAKTIFIPYDKRQMPFQPFEKNAAPHHGMAVKLAYKNRTVGYLEVARSRSPKNFSQADLDLLGNVGTHVATALYHAFVYEQQRNFNRDLEHQMRITTNQLRSANESLRAEDQTRSENLSMVTHELRNPITSISGFAKILLDQKIGTLNEIQADYCQIIFKNAENMGKIISDLLDLAKLDAKRMQLNTQTISCSELIREAVFSIQGSTPSTGSRIHIQSNEEEAYIEGDRVRLTQVVNNLLINALKYTPPQSGIRIGYRPEITHITFSVADEGMPLTPEQRMRIFEKFYRINNTASNVAGSGLGLAISKAIVLNHKGDIWVETGPNDVGNVFKFRLQRSPAPVKTPENKLTEPKARLLQI